MNSRPDDKAAGYAKNIIPRDLAGGRSNWVSCLGLVDLDDDLVQAGNSENLDGREFVGFAAVEDRSYVWARHP